jgi:hypothetical protein
MSHFLFLSTLIGVLHTSDFYMYPHPLFLLKYYCVVIKYHTNCNNSYLCDLQQKNGVSVNLLNGPTIYRRLPRVQYSREWKYSTHVNCHCQVNENYDFMSEMRKNKSKIHFVESSFGQKVFSTFPIAQYCITSPYQNGTIVVCLWKTNTNSFI